MRLKLRLKESGKRLKAVKTWGQWSVKKMKPLALLAASKWKSLELGKKASEWEWKGKAKVLHSVGFRLFTTFFVSIVALVLLVGIFSYTFAKDMLKDNVSEASLQSIILTGDKIDSTLMRYESLTTQILLETEFNERVQDLMNATDDLAKMDADRVLNDRLQARLFSDKDVSGVTLYTLAGNQFLHIGGAGSNVQYVAGETWFRNAVMNKGQTSWSASTSGGTPIITMTRQIADPKTGSGMYVIQLEMKSEALSKQLSGVKLGESGGLKRIVREDMVIVASSEPAEVTKRADLEMPETIEANGSFNDKVEGEDMMVLYASLTSVSGWVVVGSFSSDELVAQADTIFNVVLIAFILATVLAVGIGWFIVRRVGRPLIELTALMNEGERGNLTVRSQIKGKDEIGRLSASFNIMMDNITQLVHRTNDSAIQVLKTAEELADASRMTARAAKEISTATEEIAGGATTLAVEAERGQSLTDAISERVERTIHANVEMGASAEEVSRASGRGTEAMKTLIVQTEETEALTRSLVEKVGKLGESAKAVDKITGLLGDITKQTNVLSLNATIEASRAGAAGRGFMVVADEIRKLAEQSKHSIQTVSQMAKQIQSEVGETVDALSQVYPMFRQQAVSVQEADSIFGNVQLRMNELGSRLTEVTASVQELEQTQHQLSETMSGVSAVAEQSSASSEEVASLGSEQLSVSGNLVELAENLQGLSTDLKKILESFKF